MTVQYACSKTKATRLVELIRSHSFLLRSRTVPPQTPHDRNGCARLKPDLLIRPLGKFDWQGLKLASRLMAPTGRNPERHPGEFVIALDRGRAATKPSDRGRLLDSQHHARVPARPNPNWKAEMRSLAYIGLLLCVDCAKPTTVMVPRTQLAPRVDAHQHMMSPTAMAVVVLHPSLPAVTLPEELDRVLHAREQIGVSARYEDVFTAGAILLAEEEGRWWQGEERLLDAISNLPGGLQFVAKTYASDGLVGHIAGNARSADSGEETHSFLLALKKINGSWRIVSEMMTPIPPPVYAPAITAEKIIEVLDDAGIEYGVVHSLGYWFGQPGREIEDRYTKTRAENDWTVAQTGRYPNRLIPFCGVNPLADYALQELERCATMPTVRGMKIHFNNSRIDLSNAAHVQKLREFFRAANGAGLAVAAHVRGPLQPLIDEVLPAAPDVPIQVAHMASGWANAKVFADAIEAGKPGTRNLWFDWTQALPIDAEDRTPEMMAEAAATMRRLGLSRILYGSDMPLKVNPSPRDWWRKTMMTLPLTDAELRDIADNVPPYIR